MRTLCLVLLNHCETNMINYTISKMHWENFKNKTRWKLKRTFSVNLALPLHRIKDVDTLHLHLQGEGLLTWNFTPGLTLGVRFLTLTSPILASHWELQQPAWEKAKPSSENMSGAPYFKRLHIIFFWLYSQTWRGEEGKVKVLQSQLRLPTIVIHDVN